MNLSANFTYEEATHSDTALRHNIDNTPNIEQLYNIRWTALTLEKIRSFLGGYPIVVNSWYRCPALNMIVGGVPSSAHIEGFAVDFTVPEFGTVENTIKMILLGGIVQFDELVWEYDKWIHMSFDPRCRGQVFTRRAGTGYMKGLVS